MCTVNERTLFRKPWLKIYNFHAEWKNEFAFTVVKEKDCMLDMSPGFTVVEKG